MSGCRGVFVREGVSVGVVFEGIWQASEIQMRNITHALRLVTTQHLAYTSAHPFCMGWKPRDPHNSLNVNKLAVAWIAVPLWRCGAEWLQTLCQSAATSWHGTISANVLQISNVRPTMTTSALGTTSVACKHQWLTSLMRWLNILHQPFVFDCFRAIVRSLMHTYPCICQ